MPDLDAIRARCEAATPGPWTAYNANEGTEYQPAWEVANDAFHNPPADEDAPWIAVHLETGIKDDAEFIAHAREDVPALLAALASSRAEVERLTRENARLTDVVDTAVAYVTEPEGSDLVPQYWHELDDATRRYLSAGLGPDATASDAPRRSIAAAESQEGTG